ncbi:Nose resistant to fluoxetine protein 6, partial [Araneus ventricosus]
TSARIFLCFSFISNFKRLVNTETVETKSNTLSCLHGIRFLTMSWIILGHTYFLANFQALQNAEKGMPYGKLFAFQVILNGSVAVDSFFCMGGLLVCYLTLKTVKLDGKPFSVFLYIVHRLWRIYPAYIMVILIPFLDYMLSSGPLLYHLAHPHYENCHENWWTNLLFINNFYGVDKPCLVHTWYIATDLQLYIAAILILLPILRWPKVGISLTVLGILVSLLSTGVQTYVQDLAPAMLFVHFNPAKRLIPIIQTIRFCGGQQIAVRRHRDGGRIGLEEPEKNVGNFRSLMRYRANNGDNHLKDQLMNSSGRSMYASSLIRNEIINTFGHLIQSEIMRNVRKSIFYSVLADETTDIRQIEQFSLCVRYVEDQSYKIREDFLTFVPVYDVTGAGLANTVLETLSILGLDLKKMRVIANVTSVLDLLSKQRVNANDNFKTLYAQVKEIAAKLDIKEEIPRVCRLQTARNNVPYSTEEEYHRRAVYVPYLDDFCNSLKERFEFHKETVASIQHILPEFCTKTDFYSLEAAFNFYEEDLSHKEVVQSEFIFWKERWSLEKSENLPKTAISSLKKCDKTFFPNIYILLKLLAVLPSSVATVERGFSSLRRLKTYLRNTISESRLTGLALLSIHRDIKIRDVEVLDKFASVPRNLDFVL